jgi:ADP-heptose:LPS heptosyltransferase
VPRGSAQRILVVPFADGIGDFVMLLPLLQAVRRRFPTASVTVAASQRSALLLDETRLPAVAVRTPSWFRDGSARPREAGAGRVLPQSALAWLAGLSLRWEFGRFDRAFNLHLWWERGYDFRRHWTPQVPPRPAPVHTLDFLAERLGRALGVPVPAAERRPEVAPRPEAVAAAGDWWQKQGLQGRPVVALIPASNMHLKRWPAARWATLSDHLAEGGYAPLLLLPPGPDPAEAVLRHTRRPPLVLRAALDQVAAVLARCRLAVGVDTGLLHLAAAVGTRYVGLFGPTNPAVTGPYDRALGTTLVAPFVKGAPCGGCWRSFKYIDDRCLAIPESPEHSCITALSFATVREACDSDLSGAAGVWGPSGGGSALLRR